MMLVFFRTDREEVPPNIAITANMAVSCKDGQAQCRVAFMNITRLQSGSLTRSTYLQDLSTLGFSIFSMFLYCLQLSVRALRSSGDAYNLPISARVRLLIRCDGAVGDGRVCRENI